MYDTFSISTPGQIYVQNDCPPRAKRFRLRDSCSHFLSRAFPTWLTLHAHIRSLVRMRSLKSVVGSVCASKSVSCRELSLSSMATHLPSPFAVDDVHHSSRRPHHSQTGGATRWIMCRGLAACNVPRCCPRNRSQGPDFR